jgi:hypothetical protein
MGIFKLLHLQSNFKTMRVATKSDRKRVIEIIFKAYKDNPRFLSMIKPGTDEQFKKRLKWLSEFLFDTIEPLKSVFITSLGDGICMVYKNTDRKETLYTWYLQIKMAIRVIGIFRGLEILKREGMVKKLRPAGEYLYFWVLAVDPDKKGFLDMQEIRDEVYARADKINLPIVAETTVKKNRVMYLRYGFKEYNQLETSKDVTVYFMKREPGTVEERNKK